MLWNFVCSTSLESECGLGKIEGRERDWAEESYTTGGRYSENDDGENPEMENEESLYQVDNCTDDAGYSQLGPCGNVVKMNQNLARCALIGVFKNEFAHKRQTWK